MSHLEVVYILAIGGRDESEKSTSKVYRYDSHTDSWTVASRMKSRRPYSLAVTLPGDDLIVVGGYTLGYDKMKSVEFGVNTTELIIAELAFCQQ